MSDTRTGYNIEPPFPLGFICVCSFRPIDVFTISACCSNLFSNKLFTVQEMGFVQWGRSVSLVLCVTNAFSLDGLACIVGSIGKCHWIECPLHSLVYVVLPSFLFTSRIRFVLSQTWLTLTKSIEKYSHNYTIQYMHYQHILHGGFEMKQIRYCKCYYFFL